MGESPGRDPLGGSDGGFPLGGFWIDSGSILASIDRSMDLGNPSGTSCFLDESHNRVLATIARSAHGRNVEGTVVRQFAVSVTGVVIERPVRRRRRF